MAVRRFAVGQKVVVTKRKHYEDDLWWDIDPKRITGTISQVLPKRDDYDYQLTLDGEDTPSWFICDFALEPLTIKEDISEWL